MSFILDALRKSEHERQRQAGPSIAELPLAKTPSRLPLALLLVALLLLANLALVLYFVLRDRPASTDLAVTVPPVATEPAPRNPAPVVPATETLPQQPPPQPATPQPRATAVEVRPLAAEVSAPAPDTVPPAHQAPSAPDPSLLPAPRPVSPPPMSRAQEEYLPRLDSLPPQATAGLPPLNLDLHIYATDPAQRAVFINGRRYREGDALPQGVELESITTEGAVLRYRGLRFLLPRP